VSNNGAVYDYSDPDGINIKVMIWGYVKYPGQYIIPSVSSVNGLLSLAGGPIQDDNVDDLKIQLENLLAKPADLALKADLAYERVRKFYSWPTIAKEVLEVYRKSEK